MDAKQKRLIRNIVAGIMLLTLIVFVLAYCGVFEGAKSDEAQIRDLTDRTQTEINEHDWEDLLDLSNVPVEDRDRWLKAVPPIAERVKIDSITPKGFISVPSGAEEYELTCTVLAHLDVPIIGKVGPRLDAVEGTIYFVKVKGRWYIDPARSNFPYLPKPK